MHCTFLSIVENDFVEKITTGTLEKGILVTVIPLGFLNSDKSFNNEF